MNSQEEANNRFEDLENRVAKIEEAFPSKDFAGHARYHQSIIDDFLESKRIRAAVIEQVIKGSVWGLLAAAAGAAWTFMKDHFRP